MSKRKPSGKPVGRPPLYSDPLLMESKIDQYFDGCEESGKTPTVPGLCYFMGFEDRASFLDYEKKPEFSRTIRKARLRIEMDRAEKLVTSGTPTAGLIFDLTNNHKWKNPHHMKHSQDEDGEPVQSEVKIKADDAINSLLEEYHRLKAGSTDKA